MGLSLSCAEHSGGAVTSTSGGAAIINGVLGGAVISGGAIGIAVISGGSTGGDSVVISDGDTGGVAIVSGPISSVSSLSITARRYVGILVDTWPRTR